MPSQSKNPTYYDLLGVQPSASRKQIKKAFRKIMKRIHHDNVGSEYDSQTVLKINQAADFLDDPEKREKYDRKMGFNENRSEGESLSMSEISRYSRKTRQVTLLSESAAQSKRVEESVTTDRNGKRVRGGGLMITTARFGSARNYCDVTNSVQCMVQHRSNNDGGFIEIKEGLDKRTLTGLACPPGIREGDILLDIEYMFNLSMHRVRVSNFGELRIPLRKHAERFAFGSPRADPVSKLKVDLVKTRPSRAKAIMLTFTIGCFLLYWWSERKEETDKKLEPS